MANFAEAVACILLDQFVARFGVRFMAGVLIEAEIFFAIIWLGVLLAPCLDFILVD